MVKKAFSLIELIFAIVVLSVAFLAIPQLFQASSSNVEEVIKEEAAFQGIRTAGAILTYYWDESTSPDQNNSFILDTRAGDSELNRTSSTSIYRIGNQQLAKKRRFYTSITYASDSMGLEANDNNVYDDIDDFNGKQETVTSSLVDMILQPRIFYISDSANYSSNRITATIPTSALTNSTNIKMIELNVSDTNGNLILVYRTFACNIGYAPIKTETLK